MEVEFDPEARAELEQLRTREPNEHRALQVAVEKLRSFGDQLPYPHSSNVEDAVKLRELRPRQGRSRWRALYRRIGDTMVIGAIGPEAETDPRGFRRAVAAAEGRLDRIERERVR